MLSCKATTSLLIYLTIFFVFEESDTISKTKVKKIYLSLQRNLKYNYMKKQQDPSMSAINASISSEIYI